MCSAILDIPRDCLFQISRYLCASHLRLLGKTCHFFHQFVYDDELWHSKCLNEFAATDLIGCTRYRTFYLRSSNAVRADAISATRAWNQPLSDYSVFLQGLLRYGDLWNSMVRCNLQHAVDYRWCNACHDECTSQVCKWDVIAASRQFSSTSFVDVLGQHFRCRYCLMAYGRNAPACAVHVIALHNYAYEDQSDEGLDELLDMFLRPKGDSAINSHIVHNDSVNLFRVLVDRGYYDPLNDLAQGTWYMRLVTSRCDKCLEFLCDRQLIQTERIPYVVQVYLASTAVRRGASSVAAFSKLIRHVQPAVLLKYAETHRSGILYDYHLLKACLDVHSTRFLASITDIKLFLAVRYVLSDQSALFRDQLEAKIQTAHGVQCLELIAIACSLNDEWAVGCILRHQASALRRYKAGLSRLFVPKMRDHWTGKVTRRPHLHRIYELFLDHDLLDEDELLKHTPVPFCCQQMLLERKPITSLPYLLEQLAPMCFRHPGATQLLQNAFARFDPSVNLLNLLLRSAAQHQNYSCVRLLVSAGADVNSSYFSRHNALQVLLSRPCAPTDETAVDCLLLLPGVDIHVTDRHWGTPLQQAVDMMRVRDVAALLAAGASVASLRAKPRKIGNRQLRKRWVTDLDEGRARMRTIDNLISAQVATQHTDQ
eukprot:TRINITY_DN12662_c0_g1_i2.p1 TRINITY_DN12662_c0_g1~~TRINITY_DN12662_c0_g1_i2.p1  ORF type:complete len:654 (-),score=75.41 TRINITY_DN12662_c0_g1_i2:2479-4440(-)